MTISRWLRARRVPLVSHTASICYHDVTISVLTRRMNVFKSLKLKGAEGQNRTADTMIFSHVLYRLSYLGIEDYN